jgi:hypothetical protein
MANTNLSYIQFYTKPDEGQMSDKQVRNEDFSMAIAILARFSFSDQRDRDAADRLISTFARELVSAGAPQPEETKPHEPKKCDGMPSAPTPKKASAPKKKS